MKCVFDSYSDLTDGKDIGADQVFDNFTRITGAPSQDNRRLCTQVRRPVSLLKAPYD